jgi:hypothetical protein
MVIIHYQWLFMPVLSQLSPAEILWLDPHKPIARKPLYQQQTAAFNHFAQQLARQSMPQDIDVYNRQ